jgi:hypothetical protein
MTSVIDLCLWCEIDGVCCPKCRMDWAQSLGGKE